MFSSRILRSIIVLLAFSAYTIPTYTMWRSVANSFARAAQTVRTQAPKMAKVGSNITPAAAHAAQKPIIQAAKPTAQQSWWSKFTSSMNNAWAYIQQKITLPSWFSKNQISAYTKKVARNTAKAIASRAPLAAGIVAATVAQAQGQENNKFTEKEIFNRRYDTAYRKEALAFALANITAQDAVTIERIITILETYRESHEPIVKAALAHFSKTHPLLIKNILAHNAWAADDFVKQLICTENPHLEKLLSNNKIYDYQWTACHGDGLRQFSIAELAEKEKKLRVQYPVAQSNVLQHALHNYDTIPSSMITCTQKNHWPTPSEKHFCSNIKSVIWHIFEGHTIKQKTNAIPLFEQALAKEREELAKGNHIFYHGRQWEWDLVADIYKGLYNTTNSTKPRVGNDYTFLRFDDSTAKFGQALFLNIPLFGNSVKPGESTSQYVLSNEDCSSNKVKEFTPQELFSRFNLQKQYSRYENEFKQLAVLHQKANPSNIGSLLMVAVDNAHVNDIYPVDWYAYNKKPVTLSTGEQTLETKKILAELKAGILPGGGDTIEYVLPLTKEYALDPEKGPRIYAMNACDPAKYKEYTDFRDQLFAKIKADMQQNGGNIS